MFPCVRGSIKCFVPCLRSEKLKERIWALHWLTWAFIIKTGWFVPNQILEQSHIFCFYGTKYWRNWWHKYLRSYFAYNLIIFFKNLNSKLPFQMFQYYFEWKFSSPFEWTSQSSNITSPIKYSLHRRLQMSCAVERQPFNFRYLFNHLHFGSLWRECQIIWENFHFNKNKHFIWNKQGRLNW